VEAEVEVKTLVADHTSLEFLDKTLLGNLRLLAYPEAIFNFIEARIPRNKFLKESAY